MTWHGPVQRSTVVPGEGSQQELVEQAIDALEEAMDEDAVFLWTGGKEAQVIADLLLYTVGDADEQSPLPWGIIDTDNQFDAMYEFREEYLRPTGDRGADTVGPTTGVEDVTVRRYDDLLDEVILNDEDPRGYHGGWDATTELPDTDPVDGLPRSPEAWDVPASCGALKTVPLRQFVEEGGYDVVVTGRRAADPLVAGGESDGKDGAEGDGTDGSESDGDHGAESEAPGFGIRERRRQPTYHERINPLANWAEANVYAYVKAESVSLPSLYTEEGYRHTDSECCTGDDARAGEYGEGGRDPRKVAARDDLEDMGYI